MSTVSPLNMPIEEVVYYFRRGSPAVGLMIDARLRLDFTRRDHRRRNSAQPCGRRVFG